MADEQPQDPAGSPAGADPSRSEAMDAADFANLKTERDEYYDRLLRKTAEFDNYRRRVERERREQGEQATADLLLDLLLVVDDFDRAMTIGGDGGGAYRKGIELIHAKLYDLLRKQGVRPIESIGSDFDPNLHQAVSHEPSAGHREGEVIGEMRRGYMRGDRLLRPAMVTVAKS